jgi:hypothetical protein
MEEENDINTSPNQINTKISNQQHQHSPSPTINGKMASTENKIQHHSPPLNRHSSWSSPQEKKPLKQGVAWTFSTETFTPPSTKTKKPITHRATKTPPPRYGTKNKPKVLRKPKFGLPYDVKAVESRIKDQVEYDRKYQQLLKNIKENKEPEIVESPRYREAEKETTGNIIEITEKFLQNPLMHDFLD